MISAHIGNIKLQYLTGQNHLSKLAPLLQVLFVTQLTWKLSNIHMYIYILHTNIQGIQEMTFDFYFGYNMYIVYAPTLSNCINCIIDIE